MADKVPADNWDLTAVVWSCSSATDTTSTSPLQKFRTTDTATANTGVETSSGSTSENPLSFLSSLKFEEEEDPFLFPNLLQETNDGFEELQDSFKQFFNNGDPNSSTSLREQEQPPPPTSVAVLAQASSTASSSLFVFGDDLENENHCHLVHQQPQPQLRRQQQVARDHSCLHPSRHVQPRSRKRKTPQKRMVCHVTAEHLSADLWAWRKYGQKPIKDSPYPRNYYKCSSSKGCAARKQIERSVADPNIFIVSYTGDHTHPRPTHRNSLAGSSRNKLPRSQEPVADAVSHPTPPPYASMPATVTAEAFLQPSPAEEEKADAGDNNEGACGDGTADEEDDEDDLLIPNLSAALNEDPFSGMDDFHAHNPALSGTGGGC